MLDSVTNCTWSKVICGANSCCYNFGSLLWQRTPSSGRSLTCKVPCEDEGDQQDGDDDRPYSNDTIKGQLQFELHHEAGQCPTLLILRGAWQDQLLQLLAGE